MMIDLLPHLMAQAATRSPRRCRQPPSVTSGRRSPSASPVWVRAIGVGMVGAKAAEAVGRNPGAFGNILTISIIGMALAEAIAIYALISFFLYK